jgi:hypothetical protein
MPDPKNPDLDLEGMADAGDPGLIGELVEFLRDNKKWWLIPILAVLVVFGVIAALAASPVAPFIYTLF